MTVHNPDLLLPRQPFDWDAFAHEHDQAAKLIDAAFVAAYDWAMHAADLDAARDDAERLRVIACMKAEWGLWRRHRAGEFLEQLEPATAGGDS